MRRSHGSAGPRRCTRPASAGALAPRERGAGDRGQHRRPGSAGAGQRRQRPVQCHGAPRSHVGAEGPYPVARHRVSAAPAIRGFGRGRAGRCWRVPGGRGHRPPSCDAAGSQPARFEASAEAVHGRRNAKSRAPVTTRDRAPRDCGTSSHGFGRGFVVQRLRGCADAGRRHDGAARRSRRPWLRPGRKGSRRAGPTWRQAGIGRQVLRTGRSVRQRLRPRPAGRAARAQLPRASPGSQRHGAASLRARTLAASSQGRGGHGTGFGRGRGPVSRAGRGPGCGAGTQRSASSGIPGAPAATSRRGGGRAWPQDGREAQESNGRRFGLIGLAAKTDSLRGARP